MNKKVSKYNLENYGLTYSQFLKLNKKVKVVINLKYPNDERFYPYEPSVRRIKLNEILQKEYNSLIKILPHSNFKRNGLKKGPRSIEIEINTSDVKLFANKKFIGNIWIENIPGIKKREKKREKFWYAVKAIFNIQFEGFKGGMNKYEERTILVNAYSYEDAKKVAEKEFKEYSYIYLNTDLVMVRWNYEKIIDTYETDIYKNKLDPKGTEVFSEFKYRKLKPEYEWHPIKKYRKS